MSQKKQIVSSAFNPDYQNKKLDAKIIFSLERISEVFRTLLWEESKEFSISPIQIQILIFLLFHSEEKSTVSYLSEEFHVTKATMSESVRVLIDKKLVRRKANEKDSRSYFLVLTDKGKAWAERMSSFTIGMEKSLNVLSEDEKKIFFQFLFRFVEELYRNGLVHMQRMCLNCDSFEKKNGKHYCHFLKKELKQQDIRLDCSEHSEK